MKSSAAKLSLTISNLEKTKIVETNVCLVSLLELVHWYEIN